MKSATPKAPAGPPPKPSITVTSSRQAKTLDVKASVVEDSRDPVTSWNIRHATSSATMASATWSGTITDTDPSTAGLTHSLNLTGLTVNTARYVQVRAVNSVGSGTVSDIASGTLLDAATVPPRARNLTLVAGNGAISLSASVDGGLSRTGDELGISD